MHYFYIIHSKSKDAFYTGETHDIKERLIQHQNHFYKNSFTKIAADWELVLTFACEDRKNALFLEQFIKKMKIYKSLVFPKHRDCRYYKTH